ncbi:MAG: prepilin peptidase [Candidatus Geothermincolales bacterium]
MNEPYAVGVILAVLGLAVGSFDNVAIYRVPRGLSLVRPGSFCPRCRRPIAWHDNVPLLGYLLLRGRCRRCGGAISPRYPLVELLSGLLFLAVGARHGFAWKVEMLPELLMVTVLIIASFIDLDEQIIPNRVIFPAIPAALALVALVAGTRGDWGILLRSLAGAAIGGVPLGLLALLFPRGMGMGDAKLSLFTGLVLGYHQLTGFFFAFLTGSMAGLALIALGKMGRKSRIPFGPFLALGALVALFFGQRVWELYRGLMG